MKVFLDMDGVLVDFIAGAAALFKPVNPIVTRWAFYENWGLTAADFWMQIQNAGPAFWEDLPPTEECYDILDLLEKSFGVENICLLSAVLMSTAAAGKVNWIKRFLPRYKKQYLLGCAKHFMARPDAVLVDDADHNVEAFAGAGGQSILVPRPWNKNASLDTLGHVQEQVMSLSSSNKQNEP